MYEYVRGFFHIKVLWIYNPNNEKTIYRLFLRAKEENSILPELFFQTQKPAKTYMFNKVFPYSKTKLSDTDSTRSKDCLISASFSREKIVSAVILLRLFFEETLASEREGGIKIMRKPKTLQNFLEGESLTIQA